MGVRVVGMAAALAITLASAPAATAEPVHFKEFAQGAVVAWTSCPELPSAPSVCHDYTLYFARFDGAVSEGRGFGPTDRAGKPFVAQDEDFSYLLHPDGGGEDLGLVAGSATATGTYDKTHLTSAHMDAITLDLMDIDLETFEEAPTGRTLALGAFTWTAESPIYQFGNDGPLNDGVHHLGSRCQTLNRNFHQRFTLGSVTGTVDGVPLSDLSLYPQADDLEPLGAPGGIFNNWFHVTDLTKRC